MSWFGFYHLSKDGHMPFRQRRWTVEIQEGKSVFRHPRNGSVIARCSQPEVGWLGWRNANDENLIQAIAVSCALDGKRPGRDQDGELYHDVSG